MLTASRSAVFSVITNAVISASRLQYQQKLRFFSTYSGRYPFTFNVIYDIADLFQVISTLDCCFVFTCFHFYCILDSEFTVFLIPFLLHTYYRFYCIF
jgi:hypothetical protein